MTFLDYLWPTCAANVAAFLVRQRWFGGKGRPLRDVRLAEVIWLRSPPAGLALALLECHYADGPPEFYGLPLGLLVGDKPLPVPPEAVILPRVTTLGGPALLYDALAEPAACTFLLELFKLRQPLPASLGQLLVKTTPVFATLRGNQPLQVRASSAEQSNRSLLFRQGDEGKLLLKLFGRLSPGVNPDLEIAEVLTEQTSFNAMPALAGSISYQMLGQETTLALLTGFEPNEGTAWEVAGRQLARLAEQAPRGLTTPTEDDLAPLVEPTIAWAEKLGQRTAELHRALAGVTKVPAFVAEPLGPADVAAVAATIAGAGEQLPLLREPAAVAMLRDKLSLLAPEKNLGQKCRGHGDYHLGQVLCRGNDFILIDFEGEPARPVAERRRKASPLRDVAGMLRSFDYAASVFLHHAAAEEQERLALWVRGWQTVAIQAFLMGYFNTLQDTDLLPEKEAATDALVWLFSVEKAIYECEYEQRHRPAWQQIPLEGLRALLGVE